MLSEGRPTNPTYLLDNAAREARGRFDAIPALFERGTICHLENRGVRAGWQCLEVRAGGGSIAAWLATRVGPTGRVLVTDVDPRFLEPLDVPDVEVLVHNIVTDFLPEDAFDLIQCASGAHPIAGMRASIGGASGSAETGRLACR
jgi:hypothetical protein